jgi:hypothetical protein
MQSAGVDNDAAAQAKARKLRFNRPDEQFLTEGTKIDRSDEI